MWLWALFVSLASAQPPGFEGEMPSLQEALQYMNSIVDDISTDLTDANFQSLTQTANSDWFVYFYSPGCMKCQFMTPQWKFLAERVKEEGLKTNMGKVNADGNEMVLRRFRMSSFPALLYTDFRC